MDRDVDGRITAVVELTVRNDKYRGIIIEKLATENDEYFFKYQDQPIHRHCEQMQRVVRAADPKRRKKICIDVAEFSYEYWCNNVPTFKGCQLNSVKRQIERVHELKLNKEVGAMKRSITVKQNKPLKIAEYNSKIVTRLQEAEQRFQNQRAIKMHYLFGPQASNRSEGEPAGNRSQGQPNGSQLPATPQIAGAEQGAENSAQQVAQSQSSQQVAQSQSSQQVAQSQSSQQVPRPVAVVSPGVPRTPNSEAPVTNDNGTQEENDIEMEVENDLLDDVIDLSDAMEHDLPDDDEDL